MRISDWSSDVCSSDLKLLLLVFGRGIGLGDVQRDGAFAQRLEDGLGQGREPQAALDEPTGEAEALGDTVDIIIETDEILERAAFLGRRHLELMEVGRDRKSTRLNSSH